MRVSYKTIGRNIRAARTEANLTQEQTAELLKMSQLHFGRLERGERPASLEQIARIAAELHVSTAELLHGCVIGEEFGVLPDTEAEGIGHRVEKLASGCSPQAQKLMVELCRTVAENDKKGDM